MVRECPKASRPCRPGRASPSALAPLAPLFSPGPARPHKPGSAGRVSALPNADSLLELSPGAASLRHCGGAEERKEVQGAAGAQGRASGHHSSRAKPLRSARQDFNRMDDKALQGQFASFHRIGLCCAGFRAENRSAHLHLEKDAGGVRRCCCSVGQCRLCDTFASRQSFLPSVRGGQASFSRLSPWLSVGAKTSELALPRFASLRR